MKAEEYLLSIKQELKKNISNEKWAVYHQLLNSFFSIFSKAIDDSISPRTSTIVESFLHIFFNINKTLVERREYSRAIELTKKLYLTFWERNKKNEIRTNLDPFLPNNVIFKLIDSTYKMIDPNDYKSHREILNELPVQEYYVKLAEFFKFQNESLNRTISYFYERIYSNSLLSEIDRNDIIKRAIIYLNNCTYPYLSSFRKLGKDIDQSMVNDYYIKELSSILRCSYINKDIKSFRRIIDLKNSTLIGIKENQNSCFKQIVLIALMFIITDPNKTSEEKAPFLNSYIVDNNSSHTYKLVEYFKEMRFENGLNTCKKHIWCAYRNMINLTSIWKERVTGLTTFDHSPELFYILYLSFFVNVDCYENLFLEFPVRNDRADRFDVISQSFIEHLKDDKKKNRILSDYIFAFNIDISGSNKEKYISNLENIYPKLKDAFNKYIEEQEIIET